MSTNRKPPKERKCSLCREPLQLGDVSCRACGGPTESRSGYSRCGKALARYPRVFPGLQRMPVADALASGKVVLCETCGWRQVNLKPVAAG